MKNNLKHKWVILNGIEISKPDGINEGRGAIDRFVANNNCEVQKISNNRNIF